MAMLIIKAVVLLVASIAFLYAITRTEYEECDHEDCDLCPFPRCENAPKGLTKSQLRNLNGKVVTVVMKDSVFPVTVEVRDDDVYVINQFGSSTTADDVRKHGGKFFEKDCE